jgi:hypothetical protein
MSHRIDQLFRTKLSEHQRVPPAGAWEKVQSGLSKKNSLTLVWRIAAAVLVAAGLLGVYFSQIGSRAIEQTLSQQQQPVIPETQNIPEAVVPVATQPEKANVAFAESKKKNTIANKSQVTPAKEEDKMEEPVYAHIETEHPGLLAEVNEPSESLPVEKAVVIKFTLPAMVTETVIAHEDEKRSGLKRMMETARDVKNGEADLGGSLREIKNELLAFDFIRNKAKRN